MSRIYVDRISPYQSGSVQVDGLNLDTGSLTTLAEFNTYTSSNDGKVNSLIAATSSYQPAGDYATTGSNTFNGNQTFNVGSGFATFKISAPNSQFFSYDTTETFGVLKNDFSAGATLSTTSGFNTYDNSGDIGLYYNLNNVTSEGDTRPGLYSYSGSVARDVVAFPDKGWSDNGQVDFKTPVRVQNDLIASGTLGVNQPNTSLPALSVTGDRADFSVNSGTFKFDINNGVRRFYTSTDTWGNLATDFSTGISMGQQYGLNVFNSSFTIDHGFAYNMNAAAGTGTNKVGIWGVGSGGYYDFISFEDATNWTDGRIEIHRTLQVDEVLQLQPQDPLPTGAVGQLAVSGSDLYFHNGTNWILK